MNVTVKDHAAGFPIFHVTVGTSEYELSTFGGQLIGWKHGDHAILFANREHAIVDGKTAYRGGAPICFPYFGKGPLLPSDKLLAPQHGHARTSVWDAEVDEDNSSITLRTTQPTPDGFGPTSFTCELTYRFSDGVTIDSCIANVGEVAAPFQYAVHSYWVAAHPDQAVIHGLGEKFFDNLNGLAATIDSAPDEPHAAPFDRVYPDAADHLTLTTESYTLEISTEGCSGAVLWNPGTDHGLKDLATPSFVCLESGVVTPSVTLEPGGEWKASIQYRLI